jgi:hypothetical protein
LATSASAVMAICVALQFEASLNKLDPTSNVYCEQRLKCEVVNSSWNRRATAEFVANQWVEDKTDDFKHLIMIFVSALLRSCRMVSHLFAMPSTVSFLLKHGSEREKKWKWTNEKTKTSNRESNVNSLTAALHVLGKSLHLEENNSIWFVIS